MIKFAVKIGLASAAFYYVKEEGIWKSSCESEKIYQKLKETAVPYVEKATSQLPIELPKLPERNVVSSIVKESWNKGVLITFKFIADLPNNTYKWTSKGVDTVRQNEEIKKLIGSFSNENVK
ncbi:unnamed protein product [Psylliodes chrysocephalus]|uniref:MICOS complex subunit MIC13 n=1 Tax=Psylliodes chrysocephalus TaxID=3402493 RepID=A0A9P0GCP9_9CUCU|nr:unnamed protein product [Psylliodes chrysocephala]